jgi:hypothetical protein
MPVIKQYECLETFNKLELELKDDNLLLTMVHEDDTKIETLLSRGDILDLIQELEMYNQLMWENEKSAGGKNG